MWIPLDKNNTRIEFASEARGGQGGRPTVALSGFQDRTLRLLLCAALFLMIVGARWWLIGRDGTDLPFWDQWDAEATNLYKPFYNGTLTLGDLFAPHNEHRVFFSRILALGLLLANGQWDARLQMVVNAVLYAFVACGLFLILSRGRSTRFALVCGGGLAILFTLPYGWENTLAGFQSQFYFLTAFSLAAIFMLLNRPAGSWSWIAGVLSGGAALFSMASGLLAPLAVVGVLLLTAIRERSRWRELLRKTWGTAAVCAFIIVVGFLLSVKVEFHVQNYQAHSVGAFVEAFMACLAWPCRPFMLWFIASWIPFVIFLMDFLARRVNDGPGERFVLGMGLWVILQAAAIAFARTPDVDSSRYADLLSFGLIVNALSAAWLSDWQSKRGQFMRRLLVVWLLVNAVSLFEVSFNGAAAERKEIYEVERTRTAGFVVTGNFQYLYPVTNQVDIPYPDPKRLAGLLQDPEIRPILPVGVRKSLPLVPAPGSPQLSSTEPNLPALSMMMAPELWELTGTFSRFAAINSPQRFAYRTEKTQGLPFLFLSFFGNKRNLSLMDSQGARHAIISFPSDDAGQPHRAFTYCPTQECTITGFADTAGLVLMEPKEIGPLSIFAVAAGQWGRHAFGAGAALLSVLIITAVLSDIDRQDYSSLKGAKSERIEGK